MLESTNITKPFKKIPSFSNWLKENKDILPKKLELKGSVKAHGTNGCVIITKDGAHPQSKNHLLSYTQDNYDFLKFIKYRQDFFLEVYNALGQTEPLYLYGEYAGKGIQNHVGLAELERFFYIFPESGMWQFANHQLRLFYPNFWDNFHLNLIHNGLDYTTTDGTSAYDELVRFTLAVEENCPLAKRIAGLDKVDLAIKTGEGIVWKIKNRPDLGLFKTKGYKHCGEAKDQVNVSVKVKEIVPDEHLHLFTTSNYDGYIEKLGKYGTQFIPELINIINQDLSLENIDLSKNLRQRLISNTIKTYKQRVQ